MPISLDELATEVRPEKTVLLLGAGASIPSGAPDAADLARKLWRGVTGTNPISDDLAEVAFLIERKYSRRALIEELQSILRPLIPTGGLLALPQYEWPKIYTTNFDQLIESAYRKNGKNIVVIRSNFDFSATEATPGVRLNKIHGCITQDSALGHRSNVIITERDYEEYAKYRQLLFSSLQLDMFSKDVLVIGHSLGDRHLRDLALQAAKLKDQEGAPGRIFALVYQADDVRAPLLEDKGIRVAFGGIDQFVHALANRSAVIRERASGAPGAEVGELSAALLPTTVEIAHAVTMPADIKRMFNGGSATYADVRQGATFERSVVSQCVDSALDADSVALVVTGAAGVGKTTLARQIALRLFDENVAVWEHRSDFPLSSADWLAVEGRLRAKGARGVLFVDECTHSLRQVNLLINALSEQAKPALKLILTANSAQWAGRLKSSKIFQKGKMFELSVLDDFEINALVNLVAQNAQIASLVEAQFRNLTREQQRSQLKRRCSADMFVCLKNIFNFENLDTILLREFNELDEAPQEHYRYIAALEAIGTRVHRQLIMRMLSIPADAVSKILEGLTGIVDEYDIDVDEGIFGWSTRHLVIARIISEYKFSKYEDLVDLFETVVEHLNPSVRVELRSVRDLCDSEFGIGRLNRADRVRLYEKLVQIAPGERIPWHRLIREELEEGSIEEAAHLIRRAEEAAGVDSPIDRYKVRLLIARAEKTEGISPGDRVAILRKAYDQALSNIDHHRLDKYSYTTLCDVAVKLAEHGESVYILDESIKKLRKAEEDLLDPDLARNLRYFEAQRRKFG